MDRCPRPGSAARSAAFRLAVLALGDERFPSARVRVWQLRAALAARGIETQIWTWLDQDAVTATLAGEALDPRARRRLRRHKLRVLATLDAQAPYFDALLVQKALPPTPAIRRLHRRFPRLLFDWDDAVGRRGPDAARLRVLLARATFVAGGNPLLVARAQRAGAPAALLIGPIDTERFRPVSGVRCPVSGAHRPPVTEHRPPVIGWVGTPATEGALELIRGPLTAVLAAHPGGEFHAVGVSRAWAARWRQPGVRALRWTLADEPALLARFDLGVNPLPDTPHARAKSGYKLLQYMALGIPALSSPVGICRALLPGDPAFRVHPAHADEWRTALDRLLDDAPLRERLGRANRARALRCSVEAAADRWAAVCRAF